MAVFITNIDVGSAPEEALTLYYETIINKITLLLKEYAIPHAEIKLSTTDFFKDNLLKSIFNNQQPQFIPDEIMQEFQNIIPNAPMPIKANFFKKFIVFLTTQNWDNLLSDYFQLYYNFSTDGVVIIKDVKNFSLNASIYQVTFILRMSQQEKITVLLKDCHGLRAFNELLYFQLQKELFITLTDKQMPYRLMNKKDSKELLLCPFIPSVTSDIVLTLFIQAYRKTNILIFKTAIEIFIDEYIRHAVLGDLLGRTDRHLLNSLIVFKKNDDTPTEVLEDLLEFEKILMLAKNVVSLPLKTFSLIDIDLKWLLDEKSAHWALADIDSGISEINLLSLLPEFNEYEAKSQSAFEKRKMYIEHYFNVYCQQLDTILEKKELLFSAIQNNYPRIVAEEKSKILIQKISLIERTKEPVIEIFERYLLNYRTRFVYKTVLFQLINIARNTDNTQLLNALKEASLMIYFPTISNFNFEKASVFVQLQCFRGILSKNDCVKLLVPSKICWETIAATISQIAKKFHPQLFLQLENTIRFIQTDSAELLNFIVYKPNFQFSMKA